MPAPEGPTSATVSASTSSASSTRKDRRGLRYQAEARPRGSELDGEQHHSADDDEEGADRERDVEVDVELRVDRERKRLCHPLEASCEEDGGAELADPSCERKCRSGAETARGQRQGDPAKRASRAGAEGSGGGHQILVYRLERRDRLADVEGARDVDDSEDDGRLRESDADAERLEGAAEQAEAAEGGEQADPGHGRRQNERKLDERDHEPPPPEATGRDEVRGRGADEEDDRLRDEIRLEGDDQRVDGGVAAELREELARRDPREDRDDREQEEREDDRQGENEDSAEEAPRRCGRGAALCGGDASSVEGQRAPEWSLHLQMQCLCTCANSEHPQSGRVNSERGVGRGTGCRRQAD